MADRQLIALHYSPWSERARWALDHHGVHYRYTHHLPMIGEPLLRLRARKLTGRVTVPMFLDGDEVLTDSYDIARHADRIGGGATLFPAGHDEAILDFDRRSNEALALARTIVTHRTGESPEAMREALPAFIPGALRPLGQPVAALGVAFFKRKYDLDPAAIERSKAGLEAALLHLRGALAGRRYLLGGFTFADIAMAAVLQCVEPVEDRHMRLGPATRACWAQPELAGRFFDLVAWRDGLYAERRAG